ncbi:MAG: tRNA (adenosine(37)-N6)-threonylcarbamoyltransferase complex ATPase subunit type 1 TsaE [Candidatus Aenigmarchaeota archaeon]|nr:tRNA (adenosine(37)-N6)-threonylcarbamoyltransferase complex ATPase subunit type 1 TsaE [Candidatus Aenigmarchaeota archaeon]
MIQTQTIYTKSVKETMKLGRSIARQLTGGEVIALLGSLGSGKTILTKGIAKGLGIREIITSPTFVLMKVYPVKREKIHCFCHIDAYRLDKGTQLLDIGASDWLEQAKVITVIEWADQVADILPKNTILIKIKTSKKENERIIKISKNGKILSTK